MDENLIEKAKKTCQGAEEVSVDSGLRIFLSFGSSFFGCMPGDSTCYQEPSWSYARIPDGRNRLSSIS